MNKQEIERVSALDERRQLQIKNQITAIDRLLDGETTYDAAMRSLHETLALTQQDLAAANVTITNLRGELGTTASKEV